MRRTVIFLVSFLLFAYIITLFIFNKPTVSYQEAIKVAEKTTPIAEGYRISQIKGRLNWSFVFDVNPIYRFDVITVNTESGLQRNEYEIRIDGNTKEIVGTKKINNKN